MEEATNKHNQYGVVIRYLEKACIRMPATCPNKVHSRRFHQIQSARPRGGIFLPRWYDAALLELRPSGACGKETKM
jgi:hypothetical protein